MSVLAAGAIALGAFAGPAGAARPEVVAGVGRTVVLQGEPDGGGVSLALSLLWPLEDHFRVGVSGVAEDLGERVGRLVAPAGVDLGPVSALHRAALGVAWRMDALIPSRGSLTPYLAATWGVYRLRDDVRGATKRQGYAAGAGLGVGVLRAFNDRHAAGAGVRFQQLGRGSTERYLSATLEWRWGRGAAN